jgi:hypothetical protein
MNREPGASVPPTSGWDSQFPGSRRHAVKALGCPHMNQPPQAWQDWVANELRKGKTLPQIHAEVRQTLLRLTEEVAVKHDLEGLVGAVKLAIQ